MADETPEATIDRLAMENERVRWHLNDAANELHLILVSMIAGKDGDIQDRLEKLAKRLARAAKS